MGLSRAPPNQPSILCHHGVPGDDVFEPEADRGDFIRFPALAGVSVFAWRCAVAPPLCPAERRRCGSGAVLRPRCNPGPARRCCAPELCSSGWCQPGLSPLTRVGELEPRFRFILWADSIKGVFLLWLLFQNTY